MTGLLLLYLAASLLHFAHNAEYLSAYPNLPAWLTAAAMNLTIWFEVVAAAFLFAAVATLAVKRMRGERDSGTRSASANEPS